MQFDVYRIAGEGLVVDCQNDLFEDLRSRIVAPLRPANEGSVGPIRLNPSFRIDGVDYKLAMQFLRAVDRNLLTDRVTSLATDDLVIKSALDMLISGF